jgi:hypothetical protein
LWDDKHLVFDSGDAFALTARAQPHRAGLVVVLRGIAQQVQQHLLHALGIGHQAGTGLDAFQRRRVQVYRGSRQGLRAN